MKKINRWLAALMCVCVLCTSMPGGLQPVLAEGLADAVEVADEVTAQTDQEASDPTPSPTELPTAEPTEAPTAAPTEEPVAETIAEPVLELGDAQSGELEHSHDEVQQSPEAEQTQETDEEVFSFGYAAVIRDAALYAQFNALTEEIAKIRSHSIVLVTERKNESGLDRVRVCFAYDETAEEAWMDADAVEPLTEDEMSAFYATVIEAICYQENAEYPLPVPEIILPESIATEAPETTDMPQSADESGDTADDERPATMMMTSLHSVGDAADSVTMSLENTSAELKVGDSLVIKPVFSDQGSYNVNYLLSESGVVSVDAQTGTLTALKAGKVTITVKCTELANVSAEFVATVVEVDALSQDGEGVENEIVISPSSLELLVGESQTIECTIPEGMTGEITYSASSENVVTVDEHGTVTAIGAGECVITASFVTDEEGTSASEPMTATCSVQVYVLPETLTVHLVEEMDVGQTAQVTCELAEALTSRLSYRSSDPSIATVDESGRVAAVGRGACTIEVSLGELSASLPLAVFSLPEDFELTISNSQLFVGETAQMSVKLPEYTRGMVEYGSSDPVIAGIDAEGLVMVTSYGKCELTATIGEVTRSVSVEAYGKPDSIELELEDDALSVGYRTQTSVTLDEYLVASISFASSDPQIATVDENGIVTAISPGECNIIAMTEEGVQSSKLLMVFNEELELKTKYLDMAVGQSFTLQYTIDDEEYADEEVVFWSDDESVATVDYNTGYVKAVGEGEAVITAILGEYDISASCYITVHSAPTRIAITSATKTIGKGQITDAIGYALYAGSEPTVGSVKFKSSNTKVVKVNASGQMLGVNPGTAKITVTTYNSVSTSINVTVKKAPTSLKISPTSAKLAVGQQGRIKYTLSSGSAASVSYTSSDASIATVDSAGNVHAVNVGTAKIRVKTHNGLTAYCTITVNPAPTSVTLKASASKLGVDMTTKVVPTVDTTSSVSFTYHYWTDQPEIISVNEKTGEVKALQPGTANVFVETYNGVTSHTTLDGQEETSAQITVVPKPNNVTVASSTLNLMVGRIMKLPVSMTMKDGSTDCLTTYKLSTNNKKIVDVNSAGQIKGVKAGTAKVTVTAASGQTVTVTVTVRAKATKVVLNRSSATLGIGMSTSLATRVYHSSSKYYSYRAVDQLGIGQYTSNKPTVASVDAATGEIKALSVGTATITFMTYNNKKASCTVTVKAAPTVIDMNVDALKLGVDMTSMLKAVFQPNELGPVTFSSSNSEVATVNASSGQVKAIAPGTAIITISAGEGVTNTCEVTVVPKPDNVTVQSSKINLMVGSIMKLPVNMTMKDGSTDCLTTYTLSTNNKKVVAVNSAGQIKGVKAGTATVTVAAASGQKVKVTVTVRAKATKVVLNRSSATLGVGMNVGLAARVYYSSSKYFTYSSADYLGVGRYVSSNESVAKVDAATGAITAVSTGTAVISFKTNNNKTAKCTITVKNAPTSIALSKAEVTVGEKLSTAISPQFNSGEYGSVSYAVDDKNVATINSSGTITGVSAGTATVTATTHNGFTAQCLVTVKPAPDVITLNMTSSNMAIGGKITLKATATYQGSDDCIAQLKYKSSNTKVATVSSSGVIKAVKAGSATIRVYAQNNAYKDCKIVVRPKPTKVAFGSANIYLGVGQSAKVSAKVYYKGGSCSYSVNDTTYVRLTFSDPTIAKLDPTTGCIVGLEVGGTYATLTTYNGQKATCRVYVSPGPEWIEFDEGFLTMSAGESKTMSCLTSAGSVTTLSYTSSDPSVVSVSGDGTSSCKINALKKGSAVITATSSNGQTASCEVTVMAAPQSVQFAANAITIGIGETVRLPRVTVSSEDGECSQAVAYSSNSSAVSLPSPGYVTGVKAGTAVITASTMGKTATCTVTVLPETTKIEVAPASSVVAVGDTTTLKVEMDHAGGYTFDVDDDSIVSVSESGEVVALKPGKAVITATSYNDLSDSCEIIVLATPNAVRIEKDTLTINEGATAQLAVSIPENTLGELKFVSSNEDVVSVEAYSSLSVDDQGKYSVDAFGVLTANAPGTAVVRVYVDGHTGVFDTCEVTVLAKPAAIEISDDELTIRKGTSVRLGATLTGADGAACYGSVKFTSSDDSIASVTETGLITANGAGEVTITACADSDEQIVVQCNVVVIDSSVGFDVSTLTLGVGEHYSLRVDLPEGKDGFSIESSADDVAAIDSETFEITAKSVGTSIITARNGSDEATCTVYVAEKPNSIQLSTTEKRLAIGKAFNLTATLEPAGAASKLYFTSSDEKVATVTDAGRVEAVGYGTAVIRAANHDGSVYAECKVTSVYVPERIRFGELEDIVIAVGDSYTLEEPRMFNADGDCDSTCTLVSSDSNCVRISLQNGRFVLTALSEGEATLRLKTANGKTDTHKVVVTNKPEAIHFANEAIGMAVGESCMPAVLGENGAAVSVTLTTENADVVRITEDGQLLAVAKGETKITAVSKQFPELTAEATVKVLDAPSSITLNKSNVKLGLGETLKLIPEFNDGASAANVCYTSDDETVVQTGNDGTLLAVGVGTASVTATTFNGQSASCDVTVLAEPTELHVQPQSITACAKDSLQLEIGFGAESEYGSVTFESTDDRIASIDASGLVTFGAVGEAEIVVTTYNGLTAQVPVIVCETPTRVRFDPESAVILVGDSAQLNIVFDKGAGYYTLNSSDPETLSVTANGLVTAHKPGKVTVELNMPSLGMHASCTIEVVEALEGLELFAGEDKTTLELHETVQLSCKLIPENAIGSGLIRYTSSDPAVAKVDSKTGLVTGISYGTAVITASTADGQCAKIEINVLGGKRRMLIAYYFGEQGDSGYLPFAYNNGYSMQQAFSASTVEGQRYDIKGPMSNASKSTLLGAIDSHFADATDDDVSVIYICAHGSSSFGPTGEYNFLLDSSHRVMASELMNRLERIKGQVVLIMDSCHSGGMIDCNKARLDAQGGRISILTSSHRSTSSCYWSVSEKLTSVDFFTHALLQGIGFNEANGIGGSRGWFCSNGGPADDAGNKDDQITVQEMFDYAKKTTVSNVTKYKGYSAFRGNSAQVPQCYIGSKNKNLVLFARE